MCLECLGSRRVSRKEFGVSGKSESVSRKQVYLGSVSRGVVCLGRGCAPLGETTAHTAETKDHTELAAAGGWCGVCGLLRTSDGEVNADGGDVTEKRARCHLRASVVRWE